MLPLSASPPPGVGGALWPYLSCDQDWVTRGNCCLAPGPLICPRPMGPGTAMDSQLLSVLLLLLLGALSLRGQGPEPGGPSEEPGKEEVPEEDGILVLSHRTLGLALQEHPALLVEFCECTGSAGLGDPQVSPSVLNPLPRGLRGLCTRRASPMGTWLHQRAPEAEPWG